MRGSEPRSAWIAHLIRDSQEQERRISRIETATKESSVAIDELKAVVYNRAAETKLRLKPRTEENP